MFDFFVQVIGKNGMIALIGIVTFLFFFRYSQEVFSWIENQTLGTREYIVERLELLFIDFPEEKILYILLFVSLGMGAGAFILAGLLGMWLVGFILFIIVAFIGFKIPRPVIDFFVRRRIKAYQSQMVDSLTLLANGIRAGLSVPQALGMVVDEMPSPISSGI